MMRKGSSEYSVAMAPGQEAYMSVKILQKSLVRWCFYYVFIFVLISPFIFHLLHLETFNLLINAHVICILFFASELLSGGSS